MDGICGMGTLLLYEVYKKPNKREKMTAFILLLL